MGLEKELREILERLNTIIKLLALNAVRDIELQKEKILRLSSFGLRPSDIAEILGTTPNTVRVTLSEAKKKRSKGGNS